MRWTVLPSMRRFAADRAEEPRRLYLELLKSALTRMAFEDESLIPEDPDRVPVPLDLELRSVGRDWPLHAETMIGLARLENVQHAVETVITENVPGDLIETGVWRGGTVIFMRALLAAYGERSRQVWAADSFEGIPRVDTSRYPADEIATGLSEIRELAVPLAQVQANFQRYGLLDDRVRFLPGWFRDTLPTAPIERLAVLRLDGDLYESTIIALESLYPKLSPGGFTIIDDYALPMCRAAVDDYRNRHGITDSIREVDWTGIYWRRS